MYFNYAKINAVRVPKLRKETSTVGVQKLDPPEEEIKNLLNHIAMICLSEEFQVLKKELETIYLQANMENVRLTAFQDALYAFLAQDEDERDRWPRTS
jgi:hypothetical protein